MKENVTKGRGEIWMGEDLGSVWYELYNNK